MALLGAINGSREALEGQIAGVSIEVNLLQADLHKISDRVKGMESNITKLQTEVKHLKQRVLHMTTANKILADRVENGEGVLAVTTYACLDFPRERRDRQRNNL